MLIIMENIDHIVSVEEYKLIIEKCESIIYDTDTWFILTTSINNYVTYNDRICEGITVFNDLIYICSDYEHMRDFIYEQFPYIHEWTEEELMLLVSESLFEFGKMGKLKSLEAMAISKIINKTLLIDNNYIKKPCQLIYSYLES